MLFLPLLQVWLPRHQL